MGNESYHGIFTIPCTPFHADQRFDDEGLARVVDFACRCGSHGLVWPVLASEFYTLSDSERARGYRIVVEAATGRAPVVAGVAGTSIPHALELGTAAAKAGVQALIALPPYTVRLEPDAVFAYYRALGEVGLPLFVQNAGPPIGSPVSPSFLARMAREIPMVSYVKEEVPPALHRISEIVGLKEPSIQGIFAGGGGKDLIEELRRGASGNMPAASFDDLLVPIYEKFRAGDEAGARSLHQRFLTALHLVRPPGVSVVKQVLVHRGVIANATTRVPVPAFDAEDVQELDRALAGIADLMRV